MLGRQCTPTDLPMPPGAPLLQGGLHRRLAAGRAHRSRRLRARVQRWVVRQDWPEQQVCTWVSGQCSLHSAHHLPCTESCCLGLGPQHTQLQPPFCAALASPACLLPAGRWKGTMVAVKVVETHVGPEQQYDLRNEPLLRWGAPTVANQQRIRLHSFMLAAALPWLVRSTAAFPTLPIPAPCPIAVPTNPHMVAMPCVRLPAA